MSESKPSATVAAKKRRRLVRATKFAKAPRWILASQKRRQRYLRISSPLPGSGVKQAVPCPVWTEQSELRWQGSCPCCKRPLDLALVESAARPKPSPAAEGRFAYVINLWGKSAEYVLGALVLGHSIKRTKSPHSLVCLYAHDVPEHFIKLLSHIWDCRPVEHVEAVSHKLAFYVDPNHRFAKVFTKLRAMQLVDFAKVLVMDIDLIVLSNVDHLFDLQAPAAMRRGLGWVGVQHGDPIDGRRFLMGKDKSKWSWGQGSGINAGVMLWQPDLDVFQEMLSELSEPQHPEHCPGNGPEQDYLSRFWADAPWTHIGVEYNYQMHQMFLAMHPDQVNNAERVTLLQDVSNLKIIHFSGDESAKPWQRILDSRLDEYWPDRERDEDYLKLFAGEFQGYHLWVKRDPVWLKSSLECSSYRDTLQGITIAENGSMYRASDVEGEPPTCIDLPSDIEHGVMNVLRTSLMHWFDALTELEDVLGLKMREALRPTSTPGVADAVVSRPPLKHAALPKLKWEHTQGSWWGEVAPKREDSAEGALKASVLCGSTSQGRFVTMVEGGDEQYSACSPGLAGVVLKAFGTGEARLIQVPAEQDLDECLGELRGWTSTVQPGNGVLVAILGVDPSRLEPVLQALSPLGVPSVPPPGGPYAAFSAVGHRPYGENGECWQATHASNDVSYVSLILRKAPS